MRFVWVVLVVAACSDSTSGPDAVVADAPLVDAPMIDASVSDAPVSDAPVSDAPVSDAPVSDAPVSDAPVSDAQTIDAPPPPVCACDTGSGCQSGCACDPACGPLRCAPLLPSLAYFANRGGSMRGVSMADQTNGWMVGFNGMIVRVTDAMLELVESPTTRTLTSVEVVDIDTGWAVGDGVILRLQNGVWRWWTDYTPPGLLVDLDIVDDANGLASGSNGLVAQLRDGVWSTIDIGATATDFLQGVTLVDRDNGRVFGSARYQLRDGVWSSTPQVPGEHLFTAALIDRDNGWGVGHQTSHNHRLINGTWVPTKVISRHSYGIQLLDINTGWAIAWDGGFQHVLVGGQWYDQPCTNCRYLGDMDLPGGTGWLVGGQGTNNVPPTLVPVNVPGLASWSRLTPAGGTTQALVAVAVTDESVGWAVGANGTIMRLTPTGWTANPSLGVTDAFRGLALSDATHGWAVGGGGRIARLDNSWALASSPTTASLYGVAIAGDTAWAVGGPATGRPGTILRHDGVSWSLDPFIPPAEVHSIVLTDVANGWAVGGDPLGTSGTILRLQNGAWSTVMTTPDAPLWSIALDAAGDGWAVGGRFDGTTPVIWRLQAGTWTRVPFAGTSRLHGVAIDGDGLGWIVGSSATVLAIDGDGVAPCPSAMPWLVDLSAIALTPQGRAWVVGTEGMRARTR